MGEAILYQLHSLLAATALGFCRLAPTFYLLPFFASGNIPTVVRHPIIIVVSCALVQHYHYELLNLNEIDIALFAGLTFGNLTRRRLFFERYTKAVIKIQPEVILILATFTLFMLGRHSD